VHEVTVPATQQFELHSKATGRAYVISVSLPDGYASGARRYHTLYVLDGKNGFLLHTAFYRITHDDSLAPMIIVGIAWKQANYFAPTNDRELDFTPTRIGGIDSAYSGGAPHFARFLSEELFPFIEKRFRTDGDRGIIGYSFGGLFAAYALVEHPQLFHRYGIGSAPVDWDKSLLFRRLSATSGEGAQGDAIVYMSIGGGESNYRRVMFRFADSLRVHFPRMRVAMAVLDSLKHNPIIPGYLAMRALYVIPSARDGLLQSARAGGADSVIARYRVMKASEGALWVFDENQLNDVGYWLLENGRPQDAARVFKLNTEEYPKGWNAFDSLGEAYLAVGDTASAIRSYRRSIQLNPGNTNGIDVLRKLDRH
jgi:predicted alpha/beta superfamily hydrolase